MTSSSPQSLEDHLAVERASRAWDEYPAARRRALWWLVGSTLVAGLAFVGTMAVVDRFVAPGMGRYMLQVLFQVLILALASMIRPDTSAAFLSPRRRCGLSCCALTMRV